MVAPRASPFAPQPIIIREADVAQFKTLLALSAGAALLAGAAGAQTLVHDAKPSAAVTAAVADPARPAADTARDENRKPAQVVAVAGVKPGAVVVELGAGRGYYTRILSKAVGPSGKVIAIVEAPPQPNSPLVALQATYPNLSIVVDDLTKLANVAGQADVVWTTDNYHDFHNRLGDMTAFNKAAFNALKPGGVFLVEDHAAAPGAGISVTNTLHRIEPAAVRKEVEAVGFKLVRTSDVLANPADNHGGANAEASVRGKTDRFVFVFQK